MLVGRGVVMVSLQGFGKVPLELSWISSCCYFNILLGLPCAACWDFLFGARKPGHVAGLIAAEVQVAQVDEVEVARREIHWISGSGLGRKRFPLNRKTPAHLAGLVIQSRSHVWKRLRHVGPSSVSIPDHKRRRSDQDNGGYAPAQVRTGVGVIPWFLCTPTSPGLHVFNLLVAQCIHEVR